MTLSVRPRAVDSLAVADRQSATASRLLAGHPLRFSLAQAVAWAVGSFTAGSDVHSGRRLDVRLRAYRMAPRGQRAR